MFLDGISLLYPFCFVQKQFYYSFQLEIHSGEISSEGSSYGLGRILRAVHAIWERSRVRWMPFNADRLTWWFRLVEPVFGIFALEVLVEQDARLNYSWIGSNGRVRQFPFVRFAWRTLVWFSQRRHAASASVSNFPVTLVFYEIYQNLVNVYLQTRMQSIRMGRVYSSPYDALIKMVNTEGIFRPVRGIQAVFIGAGPAHAMYFACYENMKVKLEKILGHGPAAHGIAGCTAAVFHDAVMNPAEVVKQRMQMFSSPYKNCTQCFLHIWKAEGYRAFYRSYATQLTMNVPFQGIHFMMYELMQDWMNPVKTYDPRSHVISGAVAGAFAAAITTPLDVCKTLLNTQELCALNYKDKEIRGLPQAIKAVYRCCGFKGYFQGLQARVIFQMPSTAIAWSVYEFFKYFISKQNSEIFWGIFVTVWLMRTQHYWKTGTSK